MWAEPTIHLPNLDEGLLARLRKDIGDPQVMPIVADWYEERGYAGYAYMLRKDIESGTYFDPASTSLLQSWTSFAAGCHRQPTIHPHGSPVNYAHYIHKQLSSGHKGLGIVGRQLQSGIPRISFQSRYGMVTGMMLNYASFIIHGPTLLKRHPIRNVVLTGIGVPIPPMRIYIDENSPSRKSATLYFGNLCIPNDPNDRFWGGQVVGALWAVTAAQYPGVELQHTDEFLREVEAQLRDAQTRPRLGYWPGGSS